MYYLLNRDQKVWVQSHYLPYSSQLITELIWEIYDLSVNETTDITNMPTMVKKFVEKEVIIYDDGAIEFELDETHCNGDGENGGCSNCDGYNRCHRIHSCQITEIKWWLLPPLMPISNSKGSPWYHRNRLNQYLFDRGLLTILKELGPSALIGYWEGDYYGDYFVGFHLSNEAKQVVSQLLPRINSLLDLLDLEYPESKFGIMTRHRYGDGTWLFKIDPRKIKVPNRIHLERCRVRNCYQQYPFSEQISCLVRLEGSSGRPVLVDGYHRLASALIKQETSNSMNNQDEDCLAVDQCRALNKKGTPCSRKNTSDTKMPKVYCSQHRRFLERGGEVPYVWVAILRPKHVGEDVLKRERCFCDNYAVEGN